MGRAVAILLAIGVAIVGAVYWSRRGGQPDVRASGVIVTRGSDTQAVPVGSTPLPVAAPASRPTLPVPSPGPAAAATGDPAIEQALGSGADEPRGLYAQLRREPRDPAWASQSEAAIRERLVAVPYVNQPPARITCGSSVCEVSGGMAAGSSADNVNVAMQRLQGADFNQSLERDGLAQRSAVFGGDGKSATFILYFKRKS